MNKEKDNKEEIVDDYHTDKVAKDLWWHYVSKPLGVFIAKHFLIKIPITANQLTIIGTMVTIFSSYLISLGGYYLPIWGCLLLQVALVIDLADGPVARHRKTSGLFGMYVEELSHHIFPSFLMFGLAVNSFRTFGDYKIFYLLAFTLISMHISIVSRKSKTDLILWHIFLKKKIPHIFRMPKILHDPKKNFFQKIVFVVIDIFNSPGHQQTLLLIVSFFGYIHYAIFFFFVFYTVIAIVKLVIEYKLGFKIYGMDR